MWKAEDDLVGEKVVEAGLDSAEVVDSGAVDPAGVVDLAEVLDSVGVVDSAGVDSIEGELELELAARVEVGSVDSGDSELVEVDSSAVTVTVDGCSVTVRVSVTSEGVELGVEDSVEASWLGVAGSVEDAPLEMVEGSVLLTAVVASVLLLCCPLAGSLTEDVEPVEVASAEMPLSPALAVLEALAIVGVL